MRYDLNLVNAISSVIKENRITDLILGLHRKNDISESFLGGLVEGVLTTCNTTTLIYKSTQPLSTIKRHIVIVPPDAEREIGFPFWLLKVWNIGKNTGATLKFYAAANTMKFIKGVQQNHPLEADFEELQNWDEFLIISNEVKKDDNLIIVMSRGELPSHNHKMEQIPHYLDKYFKNNNFILVYPIQVAVRLNTYNFRNSTMHNPADKKYDQTKEIQKNLEEMFLNEY